MNWFENRAKDTFRICNHDWELYSSYSSSVDKVVTCWPTKDATIGRGCNHREGKIVDLLLLSRNGIKRFSCTILPWVMRPTACDRDRWFLFRRWKCPAKRPYRTSWWRCSVFLAVVSVILSPSLACRSTLFPNNRCVRGNDSRRMIW